MTSLADPDLGMVKVYHCTGAPPNQQYPTSTNQLPRLLPWSQTLH